jgi:hypothetical protein
MLNNSWRKKFGLKEGGSTWLINALIAPAAGRYTDARTVRVDNFCVRLALSSTTTPLHSTVFKFVFDFGSLVSCK